MFGVLLAAFLPAGSTHSIIFWSDAGPVPHALPIMTGSAWRWIGTFGPIVIVDDKAVSRRDKRSDPSNWSAVKEVKPRLAPAQRQVKNLAIAGAFGFAPDRNHKAGQPSRSGFAFG